jgi:hypothetical protein
MVQAITVLTVLKMLTNGKSNFLIIKIIKTNLNYFYS